MGTLYGRWRTLLLTFTICIMVIGRVESVTSCTKTDVCKCTSDEGVIDLSPLDSNSGKPGFDGIQLPSDKTWIYSYNPCTPYTEPTTGKTDCKGVAVCQYASDPTKDETYPLGLHQGNTFSVVSGKVVVSYTETGPDQKLRTSKVTLICDKNLEGKLVFNEETTLVYSFQLTSKYVCPGGGGGGTTTADITTAHVTTPSPTPTPGPSPDCDHWFYVVICQAIVMILLAIGLIVSLVTRSKTAVVNGLTNSKSSPEYSRF